jgi:hypothetical protein
MVALLVAALVLLAGCGSDPTTSTASTSLPSTSPLSTSTSSVQPASVAADPAAGAGTSDSDSADSTSSAGLAAESTSSTGLAADSTSPTGLAADCVVVADLDDPAELQRWRIVNDGVMGGRSSAQADVGDSVVSLDGEIVTDGGGFSSIRLSLDEPLGEVRQLVLRIRTDGRAYELTMADTVPGRDRRVSHQAPIPAEGGSGWEEVVVDLADLEASIFGRPVAVEPFDPTAAVEVGIILADGADGPFRFELDWIRACP